jgi:peptide/nickel transport system permease protein
MPSFSLGFVQAALLARMTRSCVLEVLKEDYVTTARAKGLRESIVLLRHALRNAMITIITVIGLIFGLLLGGAVVTEQVFTLPGVGRMVVEAVSRRDYPTVQGVIIFIAFAYAAVNLIVDLVYAFLDPRIRYE